MQKLRILYVASEVNPFLQTTEVAEFVRRVPQAMQERGMEIRILVPKFGSINERKNRLHEVVRLSGINITVGEEEKPLIIKVASIPTAKIQVYFIDNEDYFQRKYVFKDRDDKFYADNDERTIFFCKGALETVKKLGWSPDIVHCADWMTALIPLYLKTTYKNDPVFKDAKSVFSFYNNENAFDYRFEGDLFGKVKMMDIQDNQLEALADGDYEGFIKIGMQYADLVVKSGQDFSENINTLFDEISKKADITEQKEENYSDTFHDLYQALVD